MQLAIIVMKIATVKLVKPLRVLFFLSICCVLFRGSKGSPISFLDVLILCVSAMLFIAYMYVNFRQDHKKFTIIMVPVSIALALVTVWIVVFGSQ